MLSSTYLSSSSTLNTRMPNGMMLSQRSGIISHPIQLLLDRLSEGQPILSKATQVSYDMDVKFDSVYVQICSFLILLLLILFTSVIYLYLDMIQKGLEGWASLPSDAGYSRV